MKQYIILLILLVSGVLTAAPAFAQKSGTKHTVTGKVTDQSGEPLIGATVLVTGTTNGASTNATGDYSIQVPEGASLTFQYIGYEAKTEKVGARTKVDVKLEQSKQTIDEVVVIGYGTVKKTDLTGSVANVKMSDIKEIFSHPQAISQCAKFLDAMPGVKITACENTAAAAEAVAKSERTDVAAISSYNCVELYGLERLAADIQDRSNNYTRFICISKKLEIYPGADKTSLMLVLPHRPGALYQILGRFYALGMNLIKLESRPLPDREFEFMFYFDLETSVYSDEFIRLVDDLDAICEEFQYLGSYSEVI